jgi:23S rRNA-/tRNA-specific pseudouridylate synthase
VSVKLVPSTIKRLIVKEPNFKLIQMLTHHWFEGSASFWRDQIDKQCIWVNSEPARLANRPLVVGDCVLYLEEQKLPWQVIKKNDELIFLNKPAGCEFTESQFFLKQQQIEPTHLVHRLDKMTSGIFLVANTLCAQQIIEETFYHHQIEKDYLAVVWGTPVKTRGTIQAELIKRSSRHGGAHVQAVAKGLSLSSGHQVKGLKAKTQWRLLASKKGLSVLHCTPLSGRTHQVRAHLHHAGMPIIGDRDYQRRSEFSIDDTMWKGNIFFLQHLLHAYSMRLVFKGDMIHNCASLSCEFQRALEFISPKLLRHCQNLRSLGDFHGEFR